MAEESLMKYIRLYLAALLLLLLSGSIISGCGEKIAIPEPKGLFSVSAYLSAGQFTIDDPRQLAIVQGGLFVIHGDSLSRRFLGFGLTDRVPAVVGEGNLISLCGDADLGLVFVYDEIASRVLWYNTTDLSPMGSTDVPDVQTAVSMATCPTGIEQVPSAQTFLYLADPDSGGVHRYSFDVVEGLSPYGILTNDDGEGARFAHVPAGLIKDSEDSLLVCDMDPARNWVIRFFSEPDLNDTTPDEEDQDPYRGRAAQFRSLNCEPQPAAAFVLGDAPGCGESDWVGGVSDVLGEFALPQAVAVDGSGRIYVSDSGNNRIQIFLDGEFDLSFVISDEDISVPGSLAVVDRVVSPSLTHFGAYIFVVVPDENLVRKYISFEEYQRLNPGTPPPPQ